ncbi:hypothetical protein XAR_1032 [Xanthomonas citri pv. glycines str. 8ra]|nr:hypothetical protein XAR_1032 [Xanthomonas citri pv. glycines str. 8ra]
MAAHRAAIFLSTPSVGDAYLGAAMPRKPPAKSEKGERRSGIAMPLVHVDAVRRQQRSDARPLLAHLHCAGFLT